MWKYKALRLKCDATETFGGVLEISSFGKGVCRFVSERTQAVCGSRTRLSWPQGLDHVTPPYELSND